MSICDSKRFTQQSESNLYLRDWIENHPDSGNIEEFQKDFAALDKGTVKVRVFSTSSISIVTNFNVRCTKNGLRKRRRLWKVHAAWYVTCTLHATDSDFSELTCISADRAEEMREL